MKLSFLITYHDEGRWLTECLHSIVPQLCVDDEVIVYDDASARPAAEFLIADPRVRSLRGGANIGPARGRNELLRVSTGTHVHFHDADDLCAAGWREAVANVFAPGVDVVFTDVQSFDGTGARWANVTRIEQLQWERDLLGFALRGGLLAPAGTYRREVVERIGGYHPDMWQSEDYDFHIRLALASPSWIAVPEDLVVIRRHEHQRSRQAREVWSSAIDSLERNALQFPHPAAPHVARAATRAGSELFANGARNEARRAFQLAERFGGARYDRAVMQTLTGLVGAFPAEQVAAVYRKLIPVRLRTHLHGAAF